MEQDDARNAPNGGAEPNGNGGVTGETSSAAPSLTANGVLPPTSAPLKPSIYAPEVSSARDEPAPPESVAVPGDDPSTASAAAAAVSVDGQTDRAADATLTTPGQSDAAAPAPSVRDEERIGAGGTAAPVEAPVLPPAHEADARGLNGSGLASTEQKAEPADTEPVGKADADELAAKAAAAPPAEGQAVTAPGTQNPYNESEEKILAAEAPAQESATLDAQAAAKAQPAEDASAIDATADAVKEEVAPTAPTDAVAPVTSQTEPAVPAEPKTEDVTPALPSEPKMEDVTPSGAVAGEPMKSEAAPAVQAPLADGAAPSESSAIAPTGIEPPSKRQRTETPADTQLAGPNATEMTAAQIKYCQNAMKSLKGRPEAPPFLQPVDPVALNIPHYTTIIQQPMDLGTVDIKLALTAAAQKGGQKHTEKTKQATAWKLDPVRDVYRTVEDFEKDVRLVFQNCVVFNGPEHVLSKSVEGLKAVFEKQLKSMPSASQPAPPTPADTDVSMDMSIGRRGSEASTSTRPKRDIHPPAPKDLPYADRPQAAVGTGGKRRKSRGSMSAREQAHYDRVNRDQLKFVSRIIDDMHKPPLSNYAWVFFEKPSMELDFAQAYYATIKRPISLKEIKERLSLGQYEDVEGPKQDITQMINNCFTFNEPGSDVYKMGQEVQKAWNNKLEKLPQPAAPVDIDYSDDEDEDDYDDGDEADSSQAAAIRQQIAALQATLENMEGSSKAAGAKALASAKKSLADMPKKQAKRRPSDGGAGAKRASAPKKAKTSSGAAYRDASETKKPKQAKKSGGGGRRSDEVREVTYEQKEELATKITQLPDDRLDGALRIIQEDKAPGTNMDDEEIELDIDDLSPATLYKLYRYVVRPKGKKETKSKLSAHDGRKRGTGGVKRKNLDEEEEAARIARLQQQLQQFENADGPGSAPAAPAAGKAAGHDDLVASDSSSGEEESDSDSEY